VQEASAVSTAHFNSSKYVFSTLTKFGLRPKKGAGKLPVLEIGAINTQLLSCPWMDTLAIDIQSRHPDILEQDFLDMPLPEEVGSYGAIVCSMVLNCVVSPRDRGYMLQHAWEHLRPQGALLVGLPRRCVLASAYTSAGRWLAVLRCCGFQVLHIRQTPKLLFFTLRRLGVPQQLLPAKAAAGDSPGWPWMAATVKDYEAVPVLADEFEYAQSDMVIDNLVPLQQPEGGVAGGAAAAAGGGDSSPSTEAAPTAQAVSAHHGKQVPAWLRSGVKEARKLLADQAFTVQRAFRDPLICLTPRRKASKGGDKANFGVSLLTPGEHGSTLAASAVMRASGANHSTFD